MRTTTWKRVLEALEKFGLKTRDIFIDKKSGKDFDTWAKKFTELKWQGDFREEMGRSVRAMMDAWLKGRPY